MGDVGQPRVAGALRYEEGKREQNLSPSLPPEFRPSFLIALELTADHGMSREEPGRSGGKIRPGPYLPVRLSEWFGKILPSSRASACEQTARTSERVDVAGAEAGATAESTCGSRVVVIAVAPIEILGGRRADPCREHGVRVRRASGVRPSGRLIDFSSSEPVQRSLHLLLSGKIRNRRVRITTDMERKSAAATDAGRFL
jgi:hypothetical protein